MPIKKLAIADDVLQILASMNWQDDGKIGILTCGELERKTYIRVNKVLETLGGKWNRKAGGHVFDVDPRPQIKEAMDTNTIIVERDGFFETPGAVVDRMLTLVDATGRILEPSAGLGAIVDRLPVPKGTIFCVEKNEHRAQALKENGYAVHCGDFLSYSGKFDRIFMNPPFENGQDIDHVKHAYSCLKVGGAMVSVMSEGPFFRLDQKAVEFRKWLDVKGFSHQLPSKSFHESGTDINTRLVVIHKNGEEELCHQA